MQPVDIVILANGPGEVATWVRPVVKNLRQQWGQEWETLRISVILSPCTHSTGQERAIALSYPEVERVFASFGQDIADVRFFFFLVMGQN